ncbi:MAG TPA: hypothetical protein VK054_01295, partial [Beutenbergiaceae bacterium]|nr:hypothetical protein [Beutenbergiaceae bacterium]
GEPMVAIEGDEEVVCKRCELPWEVDERRANRRNRVVGSLTAEVTAASASRILEQLGSKIPEGTIYRWAHEGKLVQSESGKYVLADILEVANNQKRGRPISLAD